MHTLISRINNVSAFLSSCTMALLSLIALSSLFLGPGGDGLDGGLSIVSVKSTSVKARRYPYTRGRDGPGMNVNYNISADLTPLFHWNTKQLFVYLEADYINKQGVSNTVVVWDRIVKSKREATLKIVGKNKYEFRDLSKTFQNATSANYSLKYNLMPYVGLLTYGEAGRVSDVPFPGKKVEEV